MPADEKPRHKGFKDYKPGYLHIDTAQINLGKDKWYLFVAIDRATRYVYLELHGDKTMATAMPSSRRPWRSTRSKSRRY